MCRARLACRSPPRERRWRFVFPLDAGMGATPHSAAKPPSEPIRSGLSRAVMSSWAGGLVADAVDGDQRRAGPLDEGPQVGVEVSDLAGEPLVAFSTRP
jgi:hypothetical protein